MSTVFARSVRLQGARRCYPIALLALAGAAVAASADDPCTSSDCWGCLTQSIESCEELFPGDANAFLRQTCINGAQDSWSACLAAANQQAITNAWNELFTKLQECEQRFSDPIAIQACAEVAYENFQNTLNDILNPGAEPCQLEAINLNTGRHTYTLEDIRTSTELGRVSSGYVTRSVGQTVSLPNAGVGVDHDASELDCVATATLFATYRTKTTTVTEIVDFDADPADGSPLKAYLDPSRLIHADQVVLVAAFMDAQGYPIFFESGVVLLNDSAVSGDYNRDNLTNAADLLDYLDAYGNSVRRADLNVNGSVETEDLGIFVEELGTGS